jgi:pyruvate,orthophosphate dikinase
MSHQWVYLGNEMDQAKAYAGSWDGVRGLLGGAGARLGELTRLGVSALPGFTITTEACNAYLDSGERFPEGMWEQVTEALRAVEEQSGKRFGDPANPLLVACTPSARFSMPGLMDSILDIGLNDETARGMVTLTGDEKYVYNLYRRLVEAFGSVVSGIPDEEFWQAIEARKRRRGVEDDADLTAGDWKALTREFKAIIARHGGVGFPQDPFQQLRMVTEAAFKSWNSERAIAHRHGESIAHGLGIAVTIRAWVFGNVGRDSGIGAVLIRDPDSGENVLRGSYMMNAHGCDWVCELRPARPISELEQALPDAYARLVDACAALEEYHHEVQYVQFRLERGKLWIL